MKKQAWFGEAPVSQVVLILAAVAVAVAGCASPAPAGSVVKADTVQSDMPRLPAPSLDEASVQELVEGNAAFALDLYRVLFDREENLFYSPYSLSAVLAMTYAGARGETERQMAEALHYTLTQAQLHPAFNALDLALASPAEGEQAYRLRIANALWGQQGHEFLAPFLDTLAQNYGAGLRVVDFHRANEALRVINGWVGDQTEGKIEELLPPGSVDDQTALVLTNAVYFQATWLHPFADAMTHNGAFTLLDGRQVTVPLMEQVAMLGYSERSGLQAVELPYAESTLAMVILLPDAGTFEAFAQGLDAAELHAILGDIQPADVRLAMPRFRFEAGFELQEGLMELGMVDAFGAGADFSGMDGTRELFIDEVYHKAFVDVDEAGTEAAAASAVVMKRGKPATEHEVQVNRPFLTLIRDTDTGAILFLGHVVDPSLAQ